MYCITKQWSNMKSPQTTRATINNESIIEPLIRTDSAAQATGGLVVGLKYILVQLFIQYPLEDLYLCFNMLIQLLKLRQLTNMKIQLVSTSSVLNVVLDIMNWWYYVSILASLSYERLKSALALNEPYSAYEQYHTDILVIELPICQVLGMNL